MVEQTEEAVACTRLQFSCSDFQQRPNQALHPFGSVDCFQTRLGRMKHRLVHVLATGIHCRGQIRIQNAPQCPAEAEWCPRMDWITTSCTLYPLSSSEQVGVQHFLTLNRVHFFLFKNIFVLSNGLSGPFTRNVGLRGNSYESSYFPEGLKTLIEHWPSSQYSIVRIRKRALYRISRTTTFPIAAERTAILKVISALQATLTPKWRKVLQRLIMGR